MAASGSLRMALGHRAMAKKYNDTQAPIVQPEPVSPEVNSASREEERKGRETQGAWQVFMYGCTAPARAFWKAGRRPRGRGLVQVPLRKAGVREVGWTRWSAWARDLRPALHVYVPRRPRTEVVRMDQS